MKEIIEKYFNSWVVKDPKTMESWFSDDITYSECYGTEYINKKQCLQWFRDWNEHGTVLKWDIRDFNEIGHSCFVEWYFECEFDGSPDSFNGISVIKFSNGKISSIKEFQSKAEHYNPYKHIN